MYISIYLSICFYQTSPHQHPSDVYPHCKVNCWIPLACRGGFRSANRASSVPEIGEVSIPLPRPQIKTQILAEIIQVPTGTANLSWVAASLKVDNQCLCKAKPMPTGLSPAQVHPAAPQSLLLELHRSSASLWKHWIIVDKYCHHQCWIIRATCVLLMDYGCSKWIYWIKHPQLFGIAWQQQGVSTSWEVGHSYSFFFWDKAHAAQLGMWAVFSDHSLEQNCKIHEKRLTFFDWPLWETMTFKRFSDERQNVTALNISQSSLSFLSKQGHPKSKTKTWFSS